MIQATCPACGARSRVQDSLQGKKVRCPECREPFVVDPGTEEVPRKRRVEDRLQLEPRPVRSVPEPVLDAEEDPRPRRRREVTKPASSGTPWVLLLGGVSALLLLGCCGVGGALGWFFYVRPGPTGTQPLAQGGSGEGDPANPGGNPAAPGGGNRAAARGLRYRWQGAPLVYSVHVELEEPNSFQIHEGNCIVEVGRKARAPVPPEERKGTGTGFVVNANGFLVTCAHVVADATKVEVAIGGRSYPATVIARDEDHDLAIVKIAAQNLPVLALADSESARVGQEVRALGFPLSSVLGESLKATRGTISGINNKDGSKDFQIDASINPGNSGGPLVTESGEVLGVTSAKLAGDGISNVGFVTPSNEARKLLTANRVPFTKGAGGARLEGPALVERVSPAVALITVTLGEQADAETYRLTCRGHLIEHRQAKQGVILLPGPPRFSGMANPSQIDVDSNGHVLDAQGGTQMPALLGELGVFLIEPFPADDRPQWTTNGTCTIEEGGGGFPGRPFGRPPRPFGPPGGPFGGPAAPQGKVRQGTEVTTYKRGAVAGDTVPIQKHYELKVDGDPALTMTYDGQITFDIKNGMPRAVTIQGKLTVTEGNASRTLPLSVNYKLLEGDERERVLHPPPPPPPKPPTDAEVTQALADLQGGDVNKRRAALDVLGKAQPNDRRAEVAKAVEPLVTDQDLWVRKGAAHALVVWGNAENVPAFVKLLDDQDVFIRAEAIAALGKFKDDRAIEPLARRLTDGFDRGPASQALQGFGSKAEKAVLPYLDDRDWVTQMEACKILKAIGTRQSKDALQKLTTNGSPAVANAAREALAAVTARP